MSYDIKGQLAKLLATENLIVEHKCVETAQFNVESRVLTLPSWTVSNNDVYDSLVAHEVAHALYTPSRDWTQEEKYSKVPHAFVNIIEDARIEKLMKRRYPGLPKTFYRGYGQLYEDDFFETQGKSIDEFSFPDRINLYFKVGPFLRIEFDDDEQYFVNKIDNVDTFDDVLDVSLELRDYLFDKMSNEESTGSNQQVEVNVPGSNLEASSGEDEESIPRPEEEIADDFNTEESDETPSEEKENVPAENSAGDRCNNEFETETVTSLDNKLKDMVDKGKVESTYVEIPEIHLEDILVSSDDIRDELNSYWQEEIASRKEHDKIMSQRYPNNYTPRDMFGESDAQFNQFKKDSAKEVNYLVKEFECKKSASAYARATTSRTGVLDCTKLHTYKYNEDLFKKITVVPNGKNHGLIFILDWSGSMAHVLEDTGKQLLQLVFFCKKVNIPFEVYAFTNEWYAQRYHYNNDSWENKEDLRPERSRHENNLIIPREFALLNFLSSKSKNFDEDCLNFYRLCSYYAGYRTANATYTVPRRLSLSGTPLNEAVVSLHKIIPEFRSSCGAEKVNVVVLTDGEAHPLRRNRTVQRHWETEPYMGEASVNSNCFLRNRKTGKVTRFGHHWAEFTKLLLEDVKDTYPEVNLIGFRILSKREASQFIRTYLYGSEYWTDLDKTMESWRKDKCFSLNGTGYAKYFGLSATQLNDDYDFDEETDETMTKAQLKRAFVKSFKVKKSNKKILNEFVSLVA